MTLARWAGAHGRSRWKFAGAGGEIAMAASAGEPGTVKWRRPVGPDVRGTP